MKHILTVVVAVACSSSMAQEYSCKVEGDGVAYDLKLTLSKGVVDSVSYRSVTTDSTASICDLTVSKADKDSYSKWANKSRTESVIYVNAPGDGLASEQIRVSRSGHAYRITLGNSANFDVHRMECGMTGSLLPVIDIPLDKKVCRLK